MRNSESEEQKNKNLIENAFNDWKAGNGNVFDLLDEKVIWVVAGTSPVSETYHSKKELLATVSQINDRLASPIVPEVEEILAEGDKVVVLWHGRANTIEDMPYNNTYSWHLTIKNNKIVKVTALLDTYVLTDLLQLR